MKLLLLTLSLLSLDANAATWKKAIGGGATQVCPVNYIFVPALSTFTTIDFCVAKYEMKNDGAGMATSVAAGTPWVSIDRPTARDKCQTLGVGYDLISNAQWQTIARNIAGVASNWSSGVVASGALNAGHNDSSPNNALAASTDDYNDNCSGTGQTCSSTVWDSQRRTHTLSNGNVIWDFAGNVSEWITNDSTASNGADGYMSAISDSSIRQTRYGAAAGTFCATPSATPHCGFGYGLFNYTAGALMRGGMWSDGEGAGVFGVSLNVSSGTTQTYRGFRCVFIP